MLGLANSSAQADTRIAAVVPIVPLTVRTFTRRDAIVAFMGSTGARRIRPRRDASSRRSSTIRQESLGRQAPLKRRPRVPPAEPTTGSTCRSTSCSLAVTFSPWMCRRERRKRAGASVSRCTDSVRGNDRRSPHTGISARCCSIRRIRGLTDAHLTYMTRRHVIVAGAVTMQFGQPLRLGFVDLGRQALARHTQNLLDVFEPRCR